MHVLRQDLQRALRENRHLYLVRLQIEEHLQMLLQTVTQQQIEFQVLAVLQEEHLLLQTAVLILRQEVLLQVLLQEALVRQEVLLQVHRVVVEDKKI